MWQTEPLAGRSTAKKQRAHGCGLSKANRRDWIPNILHGIVDGEARSHTATRGVDVEIDILSRVFGFEEEELSDDGGRGCLFYLAV